MNYWKSKSDLKTKSDHLSGTADANSLHGGEYWLLTTSFGGSFPPSSTRVWGEYLDSTCTAPATLQKERADPLKNVHWRHCWYNRVETNELHWKTFTNGWTQISETNDGSLDQKKMTQGWTTQHHRTNSCQSNVRISRGPRQRWTCPIQGMVPQSKISTWLGPAAKAQLAGYHR